MIKNLDDHIYTDTDTDTDTYTYTYTNTNTNTNTYMSQQHDMNEYDYIYMFSVAYPGSKINTCHQPMADRFDHLAGKQKFRVTCQNNLRGRKNRSTLAGETT